jgi:peptidyl-prolyl cis-trans isomerase D
MFDFVHENRRLAQFILALISIPFVLWGVNSYWNSGSDVVASVDGVKITSEEFDQALRQQQERLQQMLGGRFDPAMFDTPVARQAVLNDLVNQKLLVVKARAAGLAPTDAQLAQMIAGYKELQTGGKFDPEKYAAVLRNMHTTAQALQARIADELATNQLTQMYDQNGYASKAAADSLIRVNEQQRVVHVAHLSLDPFLAQVRVDDAAVKKYYDDNQGAFVTPERARVEYIIFSSSSLVPQMIASAKDIEDYYSQNPAEFTTPEQRHALDIQIAPGSADDAGIKAAQAKAESVLAEVKRAPGKFAALAKKYSDDPISAGKGGDLGFLQRAGRSKAFDDALFALKPGQISDVVQTASGFHIIKLVEVKPQRTTPLDDVKGAIAQKIKMQNASNAFATLNDKFTDALHGDANSLKSAADLAKAQIKQSGWLERGQQGGFPWTEKALEAVFSDDVLKKHRNSAAVEIGPDTLLAVRLLDYKPSGPRPLAEVSDAIRKQLQRQQANELVVKQGEALLSKLQHGEKATVKWGPEQTLSKGGPGPDRMLAARVLEADVGKLPAYIGTQSAQGGYDLVEVNQVKDAGPVTDAKRAAYEDAMRQASGEELFSAFMVEARKHASIDMKDFAGKGKNDGGKS